MTDPSVFAAAGDASRPIAMLTWALCASAAAVVVVVGVLLAIALFRRRGTTDGITEEGERAGRRWIVIGAAISVVVLVAAFVGSVAILNAYAAGLRDPALTIRVVGSRYWWKLEYLEGGGKAPFVAANEIHIPAGEGVRLELQTADVIHSFWLPNLSGKTDLIPAQTNSMWIAADSAGHWYGQCAEYCGISHANMRLAVFADSPGRFRQWAEAQRRPAAPTPDGQALFEAKGCAACHTIRGTPARGAAGPDLTHVGSRTTLAAGLIPNSPDAMGRWLTAPDSIKPGTLMPRAGLTPAEAHRLVSFLRELR